MYCPKCQSDNQRVFNSRPTRNNMVNRRRECQDCGHRWTTFEGADVKKLYNALEVFFSQPDRAMDFYDTQYKRIITIRSIEELIDTLGGK